MRISSAGLVGIGTSSPSALLHVQAGNILVKSSSDGSNGLLRIENTAGSTAIQSYTDVNEGWFGVVEAKPLSFLTNNTRRMVINGAGDVGIGTASPAYKLDVNGVTRLGAGSPAILAGVGGAFVGGQGELYTVSTNTMGLGTTGAASMQLYTNSVERMRITSGGNLGLGTSSATYRLEVNLASGANLARFTGPEYSQTVFVGGTQGCYIQNWNSISVLGTDTASPLAFATNSTERLRITATGDVGIGTASPLARFVVSNGSNENLEVTPGNVALNGCVLQYINRTTATTRPDLSYYLSGTGVHKFYTNDSERMRITSAGLVGIGTSLPSDKLTVEEVNAGVGISGGTGSSGSPAYTNLNFRGYARNRTAVVRSFDQSASFAASGGLEFLINADMLNDTLTSAMRITGAANVGIGTTSPTAKLTTHYAGLYNTSTTRFVDITGDFAGTNPEVVSNAGAFTGLRMGSIANGKYAMMGAVSEDPVGYSRVTGLSFWTSNFDSAPLERMRINGAGQVGIGTTTPSATLHVSTGTTTNAIAGNAIAGFTSNANAVLSLNVPDANAAGLFFGYGGNPYWAGIEKDGGNGVKIVVASTERMRINSNGDIGIGTSSPTAQLHLVGPANLKTTNNSNTSGFEFGLLAGNADANGYIYQRANAALILGTNNNDRMRITAAGDVGIGTSAPGAKLQVIGSVFSQIAITGSNASGIRLEPAGSGEQFVRFVTSDGSNRAAISGQDDGGGPGSLRFYTANSLAAMTQRMLINSEGLVSIGTTATVASLTVSGAGGSGQVAGFRNALYLRSSNSTSNQSSFIVFGSAGTVSSCWIGNDIQGDGTTINRLDVQAGGSGGVYLASGGTSWTSTSDERGKDIIEPILNAVQKVGALRAVIGKYKTDQEGTRRSFLIAQDVQAVLPEAVNVGTDDQQTLGVAYTDTIPLLVAAIKELTARVAQLEGN